MGATLLGVGTFTFFASGKVLILVATCAGGIASLFKLGLQYSQSHRIGTQEEHLGEIQAWEYAYLIATWIVAVSVGLLTAVVFRQPDVRLQLLATGLLFGYCAGIVARTAIRPIIAFPALLTAAVPPIVTSALCPDASHHAVPAMFLIFLLGSFETVRHVYHTTSRHIAMCLDMAALAHKDPVTGLANRLGLQQAFDCLAPTVRAVAVFCLDLDGFKRINDCFGHAAGDQLLADAGRRIVAILESNSIVARIGGDEFVAVQFDVPCIKNAENVAEQIAQELGTPFQIGNESVSIGASVGYVMAEAHRANLAELMKLADAASYQVKRAGGAGARSAKHAQLDGRQESAISVSLAPQHPPLKSSPALAAQSRFQISRRRRVPGGR
ncbi:diguanylate cyclase domain-containing protein [Paraburkholderia caledonica]|uniref:Diguanylate cyclase (GGDEF)-like protein n=1 Tax=Paraburkholderia caledonica TaxID=134536 RepID=A0AB73INB4_9BURK|nr:diguanylate cyclase (GGDEF)-like protein [Paraburkholderia caledonica]